MGDISNHFSRSEFRCHCGCGFDTVDVELITVLEHIRETFGGRPVSVTSGSRCEKHNKAVYGAENSQHMLGKAADFTIRNVPLKKVYDYLCSTFDNRYGVGLYKLWIHIDVRPKKARW